MLAWRYVSLILMRGTFWHENSERNMRAMHEGTIVDIEFTARSRIHYESLSTPLN
jgi:hypothetical protein